LGLVDDAHAAPADFAQDAEVAQTLQGLLSAGKERTRADASGQIANFPLQVLDHYNRGEQLLEFTGDLGVLSGVLAKLKSFAAQQPLAPFRDDLANKSLIGTG